jgi:large subunit ribosomal protein L23Ae
MAKNPTGKATTQGQAAKAKTTARKIAKSVSKRSHTVRTKPRFYRPDTKVQQRKARVLRNIRAHIGTPETSETGRILIQPLSSDKNMAKMEKDNTITFLVNSFSNKVQIKQAFTKIYEAKVRSVTTLIRPDGQKKAYIRLAPGADALKVASRIGIL